MRRLAVAAVVVVGVLLYLRSPIDLVPDRLGFAGLLDDLIALCVAAWWMWRRLPALAPPPGAGPRASSRPSDERATRGASDPWDVLGVPRGASQDEIRRAYHEQMRRYHPDRVEGLGDELRELAHRRTLEIRRAWDELRARS